MAATATCLEPSPCRRPDPVPSRVAYHHPLTEYEKLQAERAMEDAQRVGMTPKGRFALPPEPVLTPDGNAQSSRAGFLQGRPFGDVVYWVACLGGACLLLLCATH